MICGVTLTDRQPSTTLAVRLGLDTNIAQEIECRQLRCYGHVVRREAQHPIKPAYELEVQGCKPPVRPKKTWTETIHDVLRRRRLSKEHAHDRKLGRSMIQGRPAFPRNLGQDGHWWWWDWWPGFIGLSRFFWFLLFWHWPYSINYIIQCLRKFKIHSVEIVSEVSQKSNVKIVTYATRKTWPKGKAI